MLRLRGLGDVFMKATRRIVGQAIFLGLVVYFGFYAVSGDRGLSRWSELRADIAQAEKTLAETRQTRLALERRAARLRDESLDLDLLSERARIVLNYSHPNDIIVMDAVGKPGSVSFVSHDD